MKTRAVIVAGLLAGLFGLGGSARAQWTFTGGYIKVGVGSDGSIIDPGTFTGIQWDGTGTGGFPVNNDIITPGTPYQFYGMGYSGGAGYGSYWLGNSLNATTVNTSSGSTFSTATTGNYGNLAYNQTMSFGQNSSVIHYTTTLRNNSATTLNNVIYASGFDPDPDVYQYGSYYTINQIVTPSVVQATGPDTGNTILIQSLPSSAVPGVVSISRSWDHDLTDLATISGGIDGIGGAGAVGQYFNGDYTIEAAWGIGSLAPGQSVEVDYNYIINGTPVTPVSPILNTPDGASTLGLLGFAVMGLNLARGFLARRKN